MAFGSLPSVLGSGGGTAYSLIGGTGLFADGTAAAPSMSFLSDPDTGFHRVAGGNIAFDSNGVVSLYFGAGGIIQAAGFTGYLTLATAGSVALTAGGTNQNITLTPSGSGILSTAAPFTAAGAISTSATPIGLCVAFALDAPHPLRLAGALHNASLTTLRYHSGDLHLQTFNATPHLPDPTWRTHR